MRREHLLAPFLAAALSLTLGACARHDSAAEREAEIHRRVEERLAAEHETQAKEALAQRATVLAERERQLASREAFFATMTASLADDSGTNASSRQSAVADPSYDQEDSYASDNSAPSTPTGAVVPASYEFEPRPQILDDTYPRDDPYYYYGSTFPSIAVINQNTRNMSCPHRFARPGMRNRPWPRLAAPVRAVARTPRPTPQINRQPRPRPARPVVPRMAHQASRTVPTVLAASARQNPR